MAFGHVLLGSHNNFMVTALGSCVALRLDGIKSSKNSCLGLEPKPKSMVPASARMYNGFSWYLSYLALYRNWSYEVTTLNMIVKMKTKWQTSVKHVGICQTIWFSVTYYLELHHAISYCISYLLPTNGTLWQDPGVS
jgi:hypothetical protein